MHRITTFIPPPPPTQILSLLFNAVSSVGPWNKIGHKRFKQIPVVSAYGTDTKTCVIVHWYIYTAQFVTKEQVCGAAGVEEHVQFQFVTMNDTHLRFSECFD